MAASSVKPLAIDLFCGLGGWTDGLLAEGWDVIGFDIERHDYGTGGYPAQLVLQDVLTLQGYQFNDAALIVASPPCQEYSYMAMPWSRAKAIAAEYRSGVRDVKQLTALFDACFRIQREASDTAGLEIPMIVENVRGAQPWVGRSCWNYGSFHLWGDVPALMPMTLRAAKMPSNLHLDQWEKTGKGLSDWTMKVAQEGQKVPGFRFDGSDKSFQTASVEGAKLMSGLRGMSHPTDAHPRDLGGPNDPRRFSSKSNNRKRASAEIAKIPLPLARYIASVYKPN